MLKEGVAAETDVKDRVVPLLRFQSSHDPSALTSLADYVARMKTSQNDIYFLTGESRAVIENSPHLEAFQAKGYEVLYLVDPIDEMVTGSVHEVEGKTLKSVGQGTVELGSDEERKQAEEDLADRKKTFENLLEFLQKNLGDWIKEARLSTRLTTSPACLVGGEGDMSPQLERLLRRAKGVDGQAKNKRILELNPDHEITTKLQARFCWEPGRPGACRLCLSASRLRFTGRGFRTPRSSKVQPGDCRSDVQRALANCHNETLSIPVGLAIPSPVDAPQC